ncbi:hypothetical protein [Nonomuraea typhae]|uniref:XRE family transcriptional regulator n=1 Tax=Nonomuraea typhae TaxID=2603600 RepID=A0ABW7Z320_9ACTN
MSGTDGDLVELLRELGQRTGKTTQRGQAEVLGVSDSAWSRYLKGHIPPEATLRTMLVNAKVPANQHLRFLAARRKAEDSGRQEDVVEAPPDPPSRPPLWRWWPVAVAVLVIGAAIGFWQLTTQPRMCDRFQVTAETLSARTEQGQQTGRNFLRSETLTVRLRGSSSGNTYWYVISENGLEGWVLPSPQWWRPLC